MSKKVEVDYGVLGAARDKVGDAVTELAAAQSRTEDAIKAPEEGAFGRSKEAHLVVQYWIESLTERAKELKECEDEAGAIYADLQLTADNYRAADDSNAKGLHAVHDSEVTAAFENKVFSEYDHDPGVIMPDRTDHGLQVINALSSLEGGPSGNANPGDLGSHVLPEIEGGAEDD